MSKYVIGIDLGTTNCALAYAEPGSNESGVVAPIETLAITQCVAAGETADRAVLPSFLYIPTQNEFAEGALALPWQKKVDRVIGEFAREHGAKVPGRLVSSAKSRLALEGVDRRSGLLPFTAPPDVKRISPVDAEAAYLSHLRDFWNHKIARKNADDRLERQEVFLTVPASFDAAARELTIEAARAAGIEIVNLLEEPQAAFYAWLASRGDAWRDKVKVGDIILVCDVGGGTTDFTLIGVSERNGDLDLTRLAVGEHILLGGDNMDLALAYAVAGSLPGGFDSLDATRKVGLVHACRDAKEILFSDPGKSSVPVTVLGSGSRVIGGTLKTALDRDTLNTVLLDGFFPICAPTDHPARGKRVGLTEIGLPYASDPAITRHLARFLSLQAESLHSAGGSLHPSAVLFNGGVFQAGELRERIVRVLSDWSGKAVSILDAADLNLAVARGAAYLGLVKKGSGIRIRGGVSRSYYIGVEASAPAVPGVVPPIKAVCVVPMGMEEGTEADVPGSEFGLVVGEPAEFRFFGSTTRRDDSIGAVIERVIPDEIAELAPLETTLEAGSGRSQGQTVPVRLKTKVTEVGSLELWCRSTRDPGEWKLEFNVRDTPSSRS
jgi:molecular chaperone DnaK (HSP70)